MVSEPLSHCRVAIPNPGGRLDWVLYASTTVPDRLIVFVHGFGGKAIGTWHRFPESGATNDWWKHADMLFVGYDSRRERPGETAAWLRKRLGSLYPLLPDELLVRGNVRLRDASDAPYSHLTLVGHSLGGFIVRLALYQQARIWLFDECETDPDAVRPPILDAQVRLFSPASAGFDPAGLLGMLASSGCFWNISTIALNRSPAYTALKKGSKLLEDTQAQTESLVDHHGKDVAALRARILWARPEQVVERAGYTTDYEAESLEPERNHSQVCKPGEGYEQPRRFVETGRHR